jgi:hypothetical protein
MGVSFGLRKKYRTRMERAESEQNRSLQSAAAITATVEDLSAFEISDMKKLPLEESNQALLRQLGTLFLSFREQRYVQNCHMAEFILYELLDPSV